MKISPTQERVFRALKNTCDVCKKYNTYEEFFDNSKNEQDTFTTGYNCNAAYNTSKLRKQKDIDAWKESEAEWYECKNNNILIVFAKTETLKKLETLGLIKIIQQAKFKNGCEKVQVIANL